MGVNGLWQVVQPCARPTNIATLNRKRLAVDASIWIYQFLKAVRDKEGHALRNSHVVGFFRRICKLLWFGILPVFVFDGGAPALKRQTINNRARRREGRREDAVRTAGKLLAVQMHRRAEEEADRQRREEERERGPERGGQEEPVPDMNDVVYVEELGMSKQERMKGRNFRKQDPYHLPDLDGSIAAMAKPEDPRIMSVEELEEYARQFNEGEDINLYDFSKIDFEGDFFNSLPSADRYNILNAARLRSRLRMGLTKEQLEVMFPDRMAFSKFQIDRVKERNMLTQRLMKEVGMTGTDLTVNVNARIAGDKDREYILVKNEGAEGGWALGVVSKEKDLGESHKPIDVDGLDFQFQAKSDPEEEDDEDFEDVPIAGLNRLPRLPSKQQPTEDGLQSEDYAAQQQKIYNGVLGEEDEDALFVGTAPEPLVEEDVEAPPHDEEEADINRAIAMSLKSQHGVGLEPTPEAEDDLFEDVEMQPPVWKQRAADTTSKPITTGSGKIVAHVVNNRANAAVARQRVADAGDRVEEDSDSDSSVDLQKTLAKANKSRNAQGGRPQPSTDNMFGGPLPFPQMDWSPGIFTKKAAEKVPDKVTASAPKTGPPVAGASLEPRGTAEEEVLAGGFVKDAKDKNAPKPLPPWLADQGDIRDSVRQQRVLENEMNAEDREIALQKERELQRETERNMIEIASSDEDSDVEVVDWSPSPERPAPSSLSEGLTLTLSSAVKEVAPAPAREASKSPELVFENVEPPQDTSTVNIDEPPAAAPEMVLAEPTLDGIAPSSPRPATEPQIEQTSTALGQQTDNDDFLFGSDAEEEEGDEEHEFSDPEDAELFAQLDEEAAEHARFASELNQKTTEENLADYEAELRQLRTQQKKDRRDADEVNHVMVTECQALLRLFGIPYVTAPMEAEAQCAELVQLGLVDGIVTDDSDALLFGATRIYKNMFSSSKLVECYLASDLDKEMSLPREQLVALAQLLGSDYTEGISGVGPVTAVEIISEFPGADGLERFREWWADVQMHGRPKDADAASPFRRKFRRSHAAKLFLPVGFPSPAVREAYLKPEVDSSGEVFQWGVPDVEGLRQFLMATIGWSKERTDDVLLPVVKDMNRRGVEGTQSNITRFFQGGVGAGAAEGFAPRQRGGGSKRMADAVGKLRQKTLGGEVGDEEGAGRASRKRARRVEDPDGEYEDGEEDGGAPTRGKGRGRGRGRGRGKKAKA